MKIGNLKDAKTGISTGILSGVTWGLDTVLVGIVLSMSILNKSEKIIFLAPFVCAFLHDTFSAVWMFIYMYIKGEFKKVFLAMKTKSGLVIILAALLGGPVGMTGYLLAVKYIGPAYTASISSVYPAIGALFAFIFLKESLNLRSWIGLILSIIGIIALGYTPNTSLSGNFMLGFIFAIICVLGWALESVICAHGMNGDEVTPEQALNIRQFTSSVVYGFIILPILGAHFLTLNILFTKASALISITALSGTASYVFWYICIHKIGATRGMALNITYAAWAIVFQVLILHTPVTFKLIIWSLVIMFGSILVTGSPKELVNFSNSAEPQLQE